MKAVAINGSPRKGGNTEILLRKALLDRAGLVAVANGGLFRRKIGAAVVGGETRGRHARASYGISSAR